jgi:membrane-associated phospholipid phosphatase
VRRTIDLFTLLPTAAGWLLAPDAWLQALQQPVPQAAGPLAPVLDALMRALSFLGSDPFLLLLVVALYWCFDRTLGRDLSILLVASGAANTLLKSLFKDPRPFWRDPALGRAGAGGYGMPSGHAQESAVVYWWLARDLFREWGRRLAGILLSLLPLLIGVSRVYLGVHDAADVLAGLALGGLVLFLYHRARPGASAWLGGLSLGRHLLAALAAAAGLFGLTVLAVSFPWGTGGAHPVRAAAADAFAVDAAALYAGMAVGLWMGLALEGRRLCFRTPGRAWQRLARVAGGVAGMALLWAVTGALSDALAAAGAGDAPALLAAFAPGARLWAALTSPSAGALQGHAPAALLAGALRTGAVAFWAAYLWPWLFVRLGWAKRVC